MDLFHPAVAAWFRARFEAPTDPQLRAWPSIRERRHTLVAAPTGSGKTLAAFLSAIDDLVRQGLEGTLADETQVLYVSPLKALSTDVQKNLREPLDGIEAELVRRGLPAVPVRVLVRTGDTTSTERSAMVKRPPHIVVTTPESLYILLTSERGRAMLQTTRTIIVDEIHALVGNKRGSHLALSLERLEALAGSPLVRIGLSATQRPIEEVARFLVGSEAPCTIIDAGHSRVLDLAIEVPGSPLQAVMSGEVWQEVYDRLAELIRAHRTTLVFVNTRRSAERATRHLSERLGAENVASHHGSMSREHRHSAEQRLKAGELRALVATASLELGIDIGSVDLVCQLGTTRSISTWLQRAGRSGHSVSGLPKGRLFPTSRDELVECAAILDSIRRGELDRLSIPDAPLDILAQQIVAAVASEEWAEEDLYALVRRAYPYRSLERARFDAVVRMLAEGFATKRGRRSAYLHRDAVNKKLRARRGARLTAITSGGAIPDNADYAVVLEPAGLVVGSLNEDFAIESLAGDIFQLGNASWRILRIEPGRVRVEDARGQAPTIPFWLGEAPSRTKELSESVSRLRTEIAHGLDSQAGVDWLVSEVGVEQAGAEQIVEYLAGAHAALGVMPSQETLVLERFFDETGGMQLVLHAPFGSRINRAWGLALRKRFCKKFNFELQAAATEDAIVLSLGPAHSFPLEEVFQYLRSDSVRDLLVQALLDAPMFAIRWRWNVSRALAVPRWRAGRRVPPQIQRMDSEDLLALVFPDQLACLQDKGVGQREIPDHPLVDQTIRDCLEEAMDIAGLERILDAMRAGRIALVARDMREPSPLAHEILNAKPYAYLDDAPLEERRTQAVMTRRWTDPETAAGLGALDAAAIARVREEAWPLVRDPDELHDALVILGFMTASEGERGAARAGAGDDADAIGRDKNEPGVTGAGGEAAARAAVSDAVTSASAPAMAAAPGGASALSALGAAAATNQIPPDHSWRSHLQDLMAQRRATILRTHPDGPQLWVAAERLVELHALFPQAQLDPRIEPPEPERAPVPSAEEALVELLRARLDGTGPTTAARIAEEAGVPVVAVESALAALEGEGFVFRGRFTPGAATEEWCARRLLARINRQTLDRMRREIQPVTAADFMRFLIEWQSVSGPEEGRQGPQSLGAVLEQLEGFEAPAAAWESDIIPARVGDYDPAWLDALCLSGRVMWARMSSPQRAQRTDRRFAEAGERLRHHVPARTSKTGAAPISGEAPADPGAARTVGSGPIRTTPIALLSRRAFGAWRGLHAEDGAEDAGLSQSSRTVLERLEVRGASFFDDLVEGTRLLKPQMEDALAELAGLGLITSDGFSGLRALLTPSDRRPSDAPGAGRRSRVLAGTIGMESAGRWTRLGRTGDDAQQTDGSATAAAARLPGSQAPMTGNVPVAGTDTAEETRRVREPGPRVRRDAKVELVARALLRRYGVVFRRVLDREGMAPPWRELLQVFRRLEARGEVRGGRFVEGFAGEQFALPDAVASLRAIRRRPADGRLVSVSAADPLNLVGVVTPGRRVPSVLSNRILFRDGIPLAIREAGEVSLLADLDPEAAWQAKNALLRRKVPPQLRFYLGRSA